MIEKVRSIIENNSELNITREYNGNYLGSIRISDITTCEYENFEIIIHSMVGDSEIIIPFTDIEISEDEISFIFQGLITYIELH